MVVILAQYAKGINKLSYDIKSIIEKYLKDGSYPRGHYNQFTNIT
jgi:hypothetical protein